MTFDPILGDEIADETPGLFAERTHLAWTRSAIALLAALAILVRRAWIHGTAPIEVVAFGFLAVAGVGWGIGILGWRFAHHRSDDTSPRAPNELLAVSCGTLAVAIAGLLVTLAPG